MVFEQTQCFPVRKQLENTHILPQKSIYPKMTIFMTLFLGYDVTVVISIFHTYFQYDFNNFPPYFITLF